MKQSRIEKTIDSCEISPQQREEISRYTRRTMKTEELFVFSILLCDNEIDRDIERFNKEALEKLAELYLGKTGVFDHMPKAENQSARIFKTKVVADGSKTSFGNDYYCLKAWAYMVRCPKNIDLILEIDGGIKKEVSVGCAVKAVVCSICGNNQKKEPCSHSKGESYNGTKCHYLLENPTDAYEWSFVAVPAQRKAGVVKRYGVVDNESRPLLDKIAKAKGNLTLSYREVAALERHLSNLGELASAGKEYRGELQKSVIRNANVAQPEMDCGLLEEICSGMNVRQLKSFSESYEKISANKMPVNLQLRGFDKGEIKQRQEEFKI